MSKVKIKKRFRVAVLDKQERLVGFKTKARTSESDVVVVEECDLPTDGSYKYDHDNHRFVPLGYGFDRPAPAPVSETRILYLLVRAMEDPPGEVVEWLAWYETNLARQHEEFREGQRKFVRQRLRNSGGA